MKIRVYRSHKVRPADYESLDFGATIEVDTDTDPDYEGVGIEDVPEIKTELLSTLDEMLDPEVNRALKLGGTMEESHLWDFYEKD